MSKKWKVIIWIVIILAVLSLVMLKVFGVDTVWSVILGLIAGVAGITKIASFITEPKNDSKGTSDTPPKKPSIPNPPVLPPKPTGNTVFEITRIDRAGDIITVNFQNKDVLYEIEDIKALVDPAGICSLANPQDFPITRLKGSGQFYVNLKHHTISSHVCDITLQCVPRRGRWSEVRHIDVIKLIEV